VTTITSVQSTAIEKKRLLRPLTVTLEDGSFSGYASLFDKVDLGKDKIAEGAFKKSLANRGRKGVRMLFQHDPSEPIGVWEVLREDAQGLFVKGRIVEASARGKEVLSLMRAGAIDGLSIGFRTIKSRTDRKTGIRTIISADLWEISIVTFPMLPQARVEQVKNTPLSSIRPVPSIREFERWLTQDAGLTRSQARTVIGKGFAQLASKQDAAGTLQFSLGEKIRQAAQLLNPRS